MTARRVDVAFTPAAFRAPVNVAIVVDLIRASTSLVTMVERGCAPIHLAATVPDARGAARDHPDFLLVGEEGGLPPEGFHHGNSPVELAGAALAGRGAIFVTTNGAPAIHAASSARTLLVGCLRNATAVAREAFDAGAEIAIICAGRSENPGGFGLDDAYCAGVLVEALARQGAVDLTETAQAAQLVTRAGADPIALLRRSAAGTNVARLGLEKDVAYCAVVDASPAVPRLGRELRLLPPHRSPHVIPHGSSP